jgi:hypothetical protein
MKNFYNSQLNSKINFKISTLLYVAILGIFFAGTANAQVAYKAEGDSQVKISIGSNQLVSNLETSALNAEGNFIIEKGKLDGIKSMELRMPIGYSAPGNEISNNIHFKVTNVMVLPILRKAFVVGFLDMNNVSKRIDMEFNITHNQDESITLSGVKKLKISDYTKEIENPTIQLASYTNYNNDELKLDMTFVFTKIIKQNVEQVQSTVSLIAAEQPKTETRFEKSGTR